MDAIVGAVVAGGLAGDSCDVSVVAQTSASVQSRLADVLP